MTSTSNELVIVFKTLQSTAAYLNRGVIKDLWLPDTGLCLLDSSASRDFASWLDSSTLRPYGTSTSSSFVFLLENVIVYEIMVDNWQLRVTVNGYFLECHYKLLAISVTKRLSNDVAKVKLCKITFACLVVRSLTHSNEAVR